MVKRLQWLVSHPSEQPVQLKAKDVLLQRDQIQGVVSNVYLSKDVLLPQYLNKVANKQASGGRNTRKRAKSTDKRKTRK